jgi:hypothetical protein
MEDVKKKVREVRSVSFSGLELEFVKTLIEAETGGSAFEASVKAGILSKISKVKTERAKEGIGGHTPWF